MLVDLRPKKATGRPTEKALDRAAITTNKNAVPFDTEKPAITSGIRLGSPAGTTRGFGPAEFREIGKLIVEVVDARGQERRGRRSGGRSERRRARRRICASVFRSTNRRKSSCHALPILRT